MSKFICCKCGKNDGEVRLYRDYNTFLNSQEIVCNAHFKKKPSFKVPLCAREDGEVYGYTSVPWELVKKFYLKPEANPKGWSFWCRGEWTKGAEPKEDIAAYLKHSERDGIVYGQYFPKDFTGLISSDEVFQKLASVAANKLKETIKFKDKSKDDVELISAAIDIAKNAVFDALVQQVIDETKSVKWTKK